MRVADPAGYDLRRLRIVEALERLGSLRAASEELALSQPALSHRLAQLRGDFDDPLFTRTSRGMKPTPRGLAVAAATRRIQAFMREQLGRGCSFDPMTESRRLTLCMSDAGEMVFLPRILAELRRHAPGLDVRTLSLPSRLVAEHLSEGIVDLAIGYFPDLSGAAIASQPLFERDFLCVAAADHPRIGGGPISLESFLAEPHLVVSPEGRADELFERTLRQAGLRRRIVLSVPHFFALPAVIATSDLIATVSRSVADAVSTYPNIRCHVPPIDVPLVRIATHWGRRFDRDPANTWLRNVICETFSERVI